MAPSVPVVDEDESNEDEDDEEEAVEEQNDESDEGAAEGVSKGKGRGLDSGIDFKALERLSINPSYTVGHAEGMPLTSTHTTASSSLPVYHNTNLAQPYTFQLAPLDPARSSQSYSNPGSGGHADMSQHVRTNAASLPADIQAQLKAVDRNYNRAWASTNDAERMERRFIRTDPSRDNEELLDARMCWFRCS